MQPARARRSVPATLDFLPMPIGVDRIALARMIVGEDVDVVESKQALVEDERVGAGAAYQVIAHLQRLSKAAIEIIVAGAAIQVISIVVAVQAVVPGVAVQPIVAVAAVDTIVPRAAADVVPAGPALQVIHSIAANERVVAVVAIERVPGAVIAGMNQVVAGPAAG